jgi:hypothetical protein
VTLLASVAVVFLIRAKPMVLSVKAAGALKVAWVCARSLAEVLICTLVPKPAALLRLIGKAITD